MNFIQTSPATFRNEIYWHCTSSQWWAFHSKWHSLLWKYSTLLKFLKNLWKSLTAPVIGEKHETDVMSHVFRYSIFPVAPLLQIVSSLLYCVRHQFASKHRRIHTETWNILWRKLPHLEIDIGELIARAICFWSFHVTHGRSMSPSILNRGTSRHAFTKCSRYIESKQKIQPSNRGQSNAADKVSQVINKRVP